MRHRLKSVTRGLAAVGLLLVVASDASAGGNGVVDLLWSVPAGDIVADDTFTVGLVARSGTLVSEPFSAMEAIIQWDPTRIALLGIDNGQDGYAWLSSGFPNNDPEDLNGSFLDGDALYQALGRFPSSQEPDPFPRASLAGVRVTNFVFRALRPGVAQIDLPTELGTFARTVVLDDLIPGLDILGNTSPGSVNIVAVPEPATAVLLIVLSSGFLFGRRRRLNGVSRSLASTGAAS